MSAKIETVIAPLKLCGDRWSARIEAVTMDVSNGAFTPPLTVATTTARATGCNGNGEPYIFLQYII